MPRPALGKVAVGDELIVISRLNAGVSKTPVVVKTVGRVWIDIVPKDSPGYAWQWRLRRDTQDDGSQRGYPTRFVTVEQHAWEQQVDNARQFLLDAGIETRAGSSWNRDEDRLLALAAFVAAYDAEHPTETD